MTDQRETTDPVDPAGPSAAGSDVEQPSPPDGLDVSHHDPAASPVPVGDPVSGAHADPADDRPATGDATDSSDDDGDPAPDEQLDPELRAAEDPRSPGQLLVALEETAEQRDDYLDALQRSRAEFDNYRRRSTREAAGARRAGVGDLAASLLEVLDDLDRTAEVAEHSADEGLAAGIGAVHRKLVDALVAAGIERVDAVGVPFDATRHEAVQQIPAEQPVDEPEVAQVLRPGYFHGDRCLRAAMVVVRQ